MLRAREPAPHRSRLGRFSRAREIAPRRADLPFDKDAGAQRAQPLCTRNGQPGNGEIAAHNMKYHCLQSRLLTAIRFPERRLLAAPPDGGALLSSRFLTGRALYASYAEHICIRAVRYFRPRVCASCYDQRPRDQSFFLRVSSLQRRPSRKIVLSAPRLHHHFTCAHTGW